MEIILVALSFLLSAVLFTQYKYVSYLLIARTILIVVLHYIYILIYPDTNGLSPIYNDEILFITHANSGVDFNIFNFIFQAGTGSFYPYILSFFTKITFDLVLFALMLNNIVFIFLLKLINSIADNMNIIRKYKIWIIYFLLISPSYIFFTSKVLRDIFIVFIVTLLFHYIIKKKKIYFIIVSSFLIFLRKHLLLSFYYAILISFKKIKLRYILVLSILILSILSIFNFPFFGNFFGSLHLYIWQFWINITGLNFIIADSSSYIASPLRVFIQRLIGLDTFVPQVILFYFLFKYRKILKFHYITSIFIILNTVYLYFYFVAGNTAGRPTILPFIPIVYIQLFYYYQQIINYKKMKYNA
jgi:hypothetical protein